MTTIESIYLAVCVAAFFTFGIALTYSVWSWESWKQSQSTPSTAATVDEHGAPQRELAA